MVMVVADGGGEGEDSGGGSGERDGRRRRNHITVSHYSIFTLTVSLELALSPCIFLFIA